MLNLLWRIALAVGLVLMGIDLARAGEVDAAAIYQQHCAACHGAQRLGAMGPALLPDSLARLRPAEAAKVIAHGRAATQMAGFEDRLDEAQIAALAAWIHTPVNPPPRWDESDIRASRTEAEGARDWPARPQWKADPLNLFVVVEGGDHHVSIVDGDRFEVMHRFASRFALHGGPKFSPDGRFVYFGSRDGWITKFDLWNLQTVAEVRAGINMRNIAVSADGRWVMAANYLPHTLALFDGELKLVKVFDAANLARTATSRVSAVYDAAPRRSFVVALKDLPELWEISYDPRAEPIHDGYVHDYKMGESLPTPGFLGIRRTPLDEPLDDFFFDAAYRHVIGAMRPKATEETASRRTADATPPKAAEPLPKAAAPGPKPDEAPSAQVINLDVRRRIASLPLPGMPHLGSGITFAWQGTTVLASPNLKDGVVSVIDMKTWKPVAQIPTLGPGFFMRSHEKTPYAWVDAMMSPKSKDTLLVIDKRTLQPVAQVRTDPGKTLAHIEFTRDGRYALASLWETDGALIVFDAATFKEVKRLPMSKPVGKYNVWNKISRSEGTSH